MKEAAARAGLLGVSAALAIVVTVAACTSSAPSRATGSAAFPRTATMAPSATAGSPPFPVTMADAKHCPVTLPRRVGPSGSARQQFFGWGSSFGNGKLWVGGLWPHGVIAASRGLSIVSAGWA